jgi:hypothetical protein
MPQSRSGHFRLEKHLLLPAGNRTSALQPVARRYTGFAIRAPSNMKSANVSSVIIICSYGLQVVNESNY